MFQGGCEGHPRFTGGVHHSAAVVRVGNLRRDPGMLDVDRRDSSAPHDEFVGHSGTRQGRRRLGGVCQPEAAHHVFDRQLDDAVLIARRQSTRAEQRNEQSCLVDVVATSLPQRTDGALHAPGVPLRVDLISHELIDADVVVVEIARLLEDLVGELHFVRGGQIGLRGYSRRIAGIEITGLDGRGQRWLPLRKLRLPERQGAGSKQRPWRAARIGLEDCACLGQRGGHPTLELRVRKQCIRLTRAQHQAQRRVEGAGELGYCLRVGVVSRLRAPLDCRGCVCL